MFWKFCYLDDYYFLFDDIEYDPSLTIYPDTVRSFRIIA